MRLLTLLFLVVVTSSICAQTKAVTPTKWHGKIRKLDTGFYGPGTGQHFDDYKKEFYATIDELLKEK